MFTVGEAVCKPRAVSPYPFAVIARRQPRSFAIIASPAEGRAKQSAGEPSSDRDCRTRYAGPQ
jgi:hypothetical protein